MFKDYKPMQFFSAVAGFLFVVATIFFLPILIKYINLHIVTKIPSLIVICFVFLTSIICWFSGIVLSTLVKQHRQNFEFQLQQTADRAKELFKDM
jgi:hypothetical protein